MDSEKGRAMKKKKRCFSIRIKILIASLIIALSTTLVSLAISYYTEVDTIKSTMKTYTKEYISFAGDNFHEMMLEGRRILLSVAVKTDIVATGISKTASEASIEGYQKKKRIKSFLSGLISQKNYIDNILVVTENGQIYQASSELIVQKDMEEAVVKEALEATRVGLFYDRELEEVWMGCPMYSRGTQVASVLVKLNYKKITEVWGVEPLSGVEIYLYGTDGRIFFSNALDEEAGTELYQKVTADGHDSGDLLINGKKQYFICDLAEGEEMTAVGVVPYDVFTKSTRELGTKFLAIGLVAAIGSLTASVYLSGKICDNLNHLTQSMKMVRSGNLQVRANIKTEDEIGVLSDTFNEMMERISELLEEIKEKEKLKREAERDVLETQIEPHFLYNTIDSMQYVAHMRGETEIEEVSLALSELLRSVLSNHDECITLWEEREYIENYLTIERFKYRELFSLVWDVDESLWGIKLPKLLLQPLVENALLHGISEKESDGLIQIKVYRQEMNLTIKVIDNGKGMEQEEIDRLLQNIQRTDKSGFRRVGLANVFQRIKLIYGENYGGTIYSCKNQFTCVELRLPG